MAAINKRYTKISYKLLLEEEEYLFCDDIWNEIKSYLFYDENQYKCIIYLRLRFLHSIRFLKLDINDLLSNFYCRNIHHVKNDIHNIQIHKNYLDQFTKLKIMTKFLLKKKFDVIYTNFRYSKKYCKLSKQLFNIFKLKFNSQLKEVKLDFETLLKKNCNDNDGFELVINYLHYTSELSLLDLNLNEGIRFNLKNDFSTDKLLKYYNYYMNIMDYYI